VIHNISLRRASSAATGIVDLFTNKLDAAAHPYYEQIAGLRVSAIFDPPRRRGYPVCFDRAAGVACRRIGLAAGAVVATIFRSASSSKVRTTTHSRTRQYATLGELARALCTRYGITDIVGHADVAPDRKTDPGPCFEWDRFRRLIGR